MRFMKNTRTGVVMNYNAAVIAAGKKEIVECNELGVPIGKPDTSVDELYAKIAELEKIIKEKDLQLDMLSVALAEKEAELAAKATGEEKLRTELEEKKLDELRAIAAEAGIENTAAMKKSAVIDAIIDAKGNSGE